MTRGVGGKVQVADYNNLRTKITAVLGTPTTGYGQVLNSIVVTTGNKVSSNNWNALRQDLINARYHQTGSDPSGSLTLATVNQDISEAIFAQYDSFADTVAANNRIIASNQGSTESVQTSTRSTNWSVSLTHTVYIDFSTADQLRYFFNAGGDIRFRAYRQGAAASTKDTAWSSMLGDNSSITGQGTIYMNYTETGTIAGTYDSIGTGSAIGFYDLTGINQQIHIKYAPIGNYSENYYSIAARVNITPNPTQLIFTITFADADIGDVPVPSPPPPYGPLQDEQVTGTLSSIVTLFRPSGPYVSVTGPSATSQAALSGS